MIPDANNRQFQPDQATRRQIEAEENAPEADLGLFLPDDHVEPDHICIHCGRRTIALENVCRACRGRRLIY